MQLIRYLVTFAAFSGADPSSVQRGAAWLARRSTAVFIMMFVVFGGQCDLGAFWRDSGAYAKTVYFRLLLVRVRVSGLYGAYFHSVPNMVHLKRGNDDTRIIF